MRQILVLMIDKYILCFDFSVEKTKQVDFKHGERIRDGHRHVVIQCYTYMDFEHLSTHSRTFHDSCMGHDSLAHTHTHRYNIYMLDFEAPPIHIVG